MEIIRHSVFGSTSNRTYSDSQSNNEMGLFSGPNNRLAIGAMCAKINSTEDRLSLATVTPA
jgi:hypothetical protein